jgi:UDP-N-acetyl-D-glucosamine dehydrogenase
LEPRAWHGNHELVSRPLTASELGAVDCVAILTDHTAIDVTALLAFAPVIVDTRNAIKGSHSHVFRLGAPRPASREVEPAGAGAAAI